MLADAQAHDGLAAGDLAEAADRELRADAFAFRHREGVLLAKPFQIGEPGPVLTRLRTLEELRERRLHVRADRQGHGLVLVQLIAIDIDVNDPAIGDEAVDVSRNTVVEAHPESQHDVCLVDGDVCVA